MYRPVTSSDEDEYRALQQRTNAVSLAGWRLLDGITFTFPSNAVLAADGYLVVAENISRLLTNYANLKSNNTYGNYNGSLRNRGERIALARPDLSISTNGIGDVHTNTVYVVVDEVSYRSRQLAQVANAGGSSLELIDPRANHRLPSNWADSDETAKAP
jgi:hypothetical protein